MDNATIAEVVKQSLPSVRRRLSACSVVVFAMRDGTIVSRGSGCLLQIGATRMALTAGHVINFPVHELCVIKANDGPVDPIQARDKCLNIKRPQNYDLGYLILSDPPEGSECYATLEDFDPYPAEISCDEAFALGFPGAAPEHREDGVKVFAGELFYGMLSSPQDFPSSDTKANFSPFVRVRYPQHISSESGIGFPLPTPKGLSGSAVWRARYKGSSVWTAERLKLVGIVIEWDRAYLKVTRCEYMLRLLGKQFPEARAFLDNRRMEAKLPALKW